MKKFSKKIISITTSFVLIAAIALTLSSCGKTFNNSSNTQSVAITEKNDDVKTLGEGKTSFLFYVTDLEGNRTKFKINTDEKTVGEALLKLNLISGDNSDYGLYVKNVNGITADYDKDKTFWGFFVDGEMAQKGADQTEINANSVYEFKISK